MTHFDEKAVQIRFQIHKGIPLILKQIKETMMDTKYVYHFVTG